MKAVAYSIKNFEKEFLAAANTDKHNITLLSDTLNLSTVHYAEGNEAVIVFTNDDVSAPVIEKLALFGVKYIATRSVGTDHIDKNAAAAKGISIANVPSYSPQAIAEHTVALALSLSRHLIIADAHSHDFDFDLDELIGFNFYEKTVGLIGLGHIGQAAANIFNGMGCRVLGYDIATPETSNHIEMVTLDELLGQCDVISLHTPLNEGNKHMINAASINLMKTGVMLLNTSRGALINTEDALTALENGKIGYLGIDVYEYEKGLFFEHHENDAIKDSLLQRLMKHPNVIVTPHQAFLTKEALQQIADKTIKNLDEWQLS